MAGTKKTDNHYLKDKIMLRASFIGDEPHNVLDCFGGRGEVWAGVDIVTGKRHGRLPIDIREDVGFHLHGDNTSYLESLELSRFTVIDLDAYGVPYEQLKTVFKRRYKGIVFVTFIQTMMGQLPYGLLEDVGFSREMIQKTPTLFGRRGWEYFLQWLALNGVKRIEHRSKGRKHYLGFVLD